MSTVNTKLGNCGNASDAKNTAFPVFKSIVHHRPGFEYEVQKHEYETRKKEPDMHGNHAFPLREKIDIPRQSLADRINNIKKGE